MTRKRKNNRRKKSKRRRGGVRFGWPSWRPSWYSSTKETYNNSDTDEPNYDDIIYKEPSMTQEEWAANLVAEREKDERERVAARKASNLRGRQDVAAIELSNLGRSAKEKEENIAKNNLLRRRDERKNAARRDRLAADEKDKLDADELRDKLAAAEQSERERLDADNVRLATEQAEKVKLASAASLPLPIPNPESYQTALNSTTVTQNKKQAFVAEAGDQELLEGLDENKKEQLQKKLSRCQFYKSLLESNNIEIPEYVSLTEMEEELKNLFARRSELENKIQTETEPKEKIKKQQELAKIEYTDIEKLIKYINASPEKKIEQREQAKAEKAKLAPILLEAYEEMIKYVPKNLKELSVKNLTEMGYSNELAKRLFKFQNCFRFIITEPAKTKEDHIAILRQCDFKSLDYFELGAIIYSLPEFTDKAKQDWKTQVIEGFQNKLKDESFVKKHNKAYNGQVGRADGNTIVQQSTFVSPTQQPNPLPSRPTINLGISKTGAVNALAGLPIVDGTEVLYQGEKYFVTSSQGVRNKTYTLCKTDPCGPNETPVTGISRESIVTKADSSAPAQKSPLKLTSNSGAPVNLALDLQAALKKRGGPIGGYYKKHRVTKKRRNISRRTTRRRHYRSRR